MTRRPELSVVIPVYNEEANLPELLERTLETLRGLGRPFGLILVDDGSRDSSAELLRAAARSEPEVVAVILNRNYGQHAAIMAGFELAAGEIVITLDADLQNPPEEIPKLVQELDGGHDVVGSVRTPRDDSLFRRLASAVVNRAVRSVTGVLMHDYGCMLRGYRRHVVDAMLACPERSTFIPVLANSFARSATEVPVQHAARQKGTSKYGLWRLITLQFDLLTSMTTLPLRVLTVLGVGMAALGFSCGLLLLAGRLAYGPDWAAQGVFTLFAALFVFMGAQFVAMGLLGEYVGRIYLDVRARPRYFVQEVVGGPAAEDEGAMTLGAGASPAGERMTQ